MSYTNVPGGTAHWVFTDVTGNYNNGAGDVAITITKPMRRSMSRATLVRMTARRTALPARPRASSPRHSLAWISG
jgi:hypothetical protein